MSQPASRGDQGEGNDGGDPHGLNRDLIALLALPAMWRATAGAGRVAVVDVLLDVLLSMLRLDWAFARLTEPTVDVARVNRRVDSAACAVVIGGALDTALRARPLALPAEVDDPWGGGRARLATAPLAIDGGVVVVASSRPHFPTERDLLILRVAANQTSIGLEAARLMEAEKRRAAQLAQLATAALSINAAGSVDAVLRTATEHARNIIGVRDVSTVMAGAAAAPDSAPRRSRTDLAAPMVARDGAPIGVMRLSGKTAGDFDEDDERIAVQLAQMAAVAIENARLTEDLRQSRAVAVEADRRKDEFLAMLGHELRNPLAPIVTALEIMKFRGDRDGAHEREVIERQVRHVAHLVDDLLDISRITRGKVDLRRSRVELSSAITKALEVAMPLIEVREHALEVDVPATGLLVDGDPVRLAQIFANLLTNAAKYTDRRGHIRVRGRAVDDQVIVTVTDDGTGIAKEALPRIFEAFVQGARAIDRADGGLGLGLAIVQALVRLHGGSVSAHSDGPGKGSEFTVTLPAAELTRGTATTARSATGRSDGARGLRILLVDDNGDARTMLAEALELYGHHVEDAADGPQALAVGSAGDFDVALLDIGLPVMDGYELARRLRAMKGAGLRMYAITGYGLDRDRSDAAAAGFDGHFVKPVDLAALAKVLQSVGRGAG